MPVEPARVSSGSGRALNGHTRVVALRLCEALFPEGERLPAPHVPTLVASLDATLVDNTLLRRCIVLLLWWLELRYAFSHLRLFSAASRPSRSALLRRLASSVVSGSLLRVLSAPLRSAYLLADENLAPMSARSRVRVPSVRERASFHDRVTRAEELTEALEIACDVVVIGTGAGGAVAAAELAEQGLSVVMIEEGQYYDRSDFNGKLSELVPKLYRAPGAISAWGNNIIPIPLGRSVGGTTTVNCGTCMRAPDATLADWRAEGLHTCTTEALEPYFTEVERILKVRPAEPAYIGAIGEVIAEGARRVALNQALPLTRNAEGCEGQGLCQFGCPTGAKQSTNVSFVPRALAHDARLFTGFRARDILRNGAQTSGVRAFGTSATGQRVTLHVRARATIVAMGALLTPTFLRNNGVRNSWLGKNLSIHPAGAVLAWYPDRVFNNGATIQQGVGIHDLKHEGLMFEGGTYPFFAHGFVNPLQAEDFVRFTERYQQTAYFGFMIKDSSRGRVRRGLHRDVPLITYTMNSADFALFKRGVDTLARVHFAAGAKEVWLPSLNDVRTLRNVEELATFWQSAPKPRRFLMSAYHPLGTSRIASSPARGVCDAQHAVWGHPGLYVMDGSSLPSSLGANPQVTIMAMAMRAARILGAQLRGMEPSRALPMCTPPASVGHARLA